MTYVLYNPKRDYIALYHDIVRLEQGGIELPGIIEFGTIKIPAPFDQVLKAGWVVIGEL